MEACGLRVFANVTDAEMVELYLTADLYMNFSRWEGYNLDAAPGHPQVVTVMPSAEAQ